MDLTTQRRQFIVRVSVCCVCVCVCVCVWVWERLCEEIHLGMFFWESFHVRANDFIQCNGEWLGERRFNENRSLAKSERKCVLPLKKSSRLNDSLTLYVSISPSLSPSIFLKWPLFCWVYTKRGRREWVKEREREREEGSERESERER